MKIRENVIFLFVSISLYSNGMVNGNGIPKKSDKSVSADPQSAATGVKSKIAPKNTCIIPEANSDRIYTISCPTEAPCLVDESTDILVVANYTLLHIQCKPGYIPAYNFKDKTICLPDGEWLPKIVGCQKTCKIKAPRGTLITCTHNNRKISCRGNLKIGTHVTSRCKSRYARNESSSHTSSHPVVCQHNGHWSGSLSPCTPTCGTRLGSGTLVPMNEEKAMYGDSPWHVGIYIKNTSQETQSFDLICAGTIITPYLILSTGQCFYDDIQNNVHVPQDYVAVVSKYDSNYSVTDNEQTGYYAIRNISFPEIDVSGTRNAFQLNVAILEVENKIFLSPAVMPACLPWDKISTSFATLVEGTPLKVTGWGTDDPNETSDYLKSSTINYITRETCIAKAAEELQTDYNKWLINYLSPDKLCAGNKTGHLISPGDTGSGLMYQNKLNSLYYLLGVVGYKENLGKTSVVAFTNVLFYLDWIKKIRNEVHSRREGISNDSVADDHDKIANMEESSEEETENEETPTMTEHSKTEHSKIEHSKTEHSKIEHSKLEHSKIEYSTIKAHTEGRVNRSTPTNCPIPDPNVYNFDYKVSCPKQYSESECQKFIKSSNTVPEYSYLSARCFKGYTPDMNQELESVCLKNLWRPALKPCKKICRKLKPENVLLKCTYQETHIDCDQDLRSGTKVSAECNPEYRPEFTPDYAEITCGDDGEWNAVLFRCVPLCGRSSMFNIKGLIYGGHSAKFGEFPWHVAIYDRTKKHPNDLICGGTILTQYIVLSAAHCFYDRVKQVMKDPHHYEIAVGKITREREILDSEITQIYKVKKIYTNNFHGILLRYQNDIAILEIEPKIIFNPYVMPACLHYSKNVIMQSGDRLKVAGWGLDEYERPSSLLKITELCIYDSNECIDKAPPELVEFFSSDKYCTGNITGDTVASGDSGGGLFQQDVLNSLYYIYGIVSFKSTALSSFIGITNVNYFSDWITSTKNEIHASRLS